MNCLAKFVVSLGLLAAVGCGQASVRVSGRVTCQEKPVSGSILFSPAGDNDGKSGPSVSTALSEDGTYQVQLTTVGKYAVSVTPRDVRFPVPPGQFDYPCDRSPVVREVQAGDNDITIQMAPRQK